MASPRPRYWGGDPATQGLYDMYWRQQQEREQRRRDLEYFDRYGFFPQDRAANEAAMGAAEAEWQQLVSELQGAIDQYQADPLAQQIRDYFSGVMSGEDLPFDDRTIAALVSQEAAPHYAGAQNLQQRLRESFAARNLGRSGGLGSMEARIQQEAIQNAARAASRIRAQAQQANYGARQQATQGAASFFGQQAGQRNQLISELARLRAQRQYDPAYFRGGRNAGYNPAGSDFEYTVPSPIERRRTGKSAPQYTFTR